MSGSRRTRETAAVVVIGGGGIGVSTAYHLAARGLTDVVLLERAVLGAGSTGRAAGGIRLQFADELNVRIMLRSLPAFERFHEQMGADAGFRQVGYLILLTRDQDVRSFETAVELQQHLGVPVRLLSAEEASERVPQLAVDDVLAATLCERDGHATPEAVVQGYAAAASARGVRIHQGREAIGIRRSGQRITAVETSKGPIGTSCVVCAAGVGARRVGAWVDVALPVTAQPHWLHYSPDDCGLPDPLPLTIDFASGFYVHREGPGLLIGGRERSIDEMAVAATRRIPSLEAMGVQASWWGDYDMSPDASAIIGEAPEVARFLYATGFSGHGFQQSPAVGEHLAELVDGVEPTLDLSALSSERFARAQHRTEAFVI